jgi:hypothetical protein
VQGNSSVEEELPQCRFFALFALFAVKLNRFFQGARYFTGMSCSPQIMASSICLPSGVLTSTPG